MNALLTYLPIELIFIVICFIFITKIVKTPTKGRRNSGKLITKNSNLLVGVIFILIALIFLPSLFTNGNNLAPISSWNGGNQGQAGITYSVTHNGNPSMFNNADPNGQSREVNGPWINLSSGDHVFMSVWIKTGTPSGNPNYGARIGVDLYGAYSGSGGSVTIVDNLPSVGGWAGVQCAFSYTPQETFNPTWTSTTGTASGTNVVFVPWGRDWTLQTYDFIVPSKSYTWGYTGKPQDANGFGSIPATQVIGMIVWLDARPTTESAVAWYSEPTVYINPAG